jgi:hypothetical protein
MRKQMFTNLDDLDLSKVAEVVNKLSDSPPARKMRVVLYSSKA